jgi:hypothetical protein
MKYCVAVLLALAAGVRAEAAMPPPGAQDPRSALAATVTADPILAPDGGTPGGSGSTSGGPTTASAPEPSSLALAALGTAAAACRLARRRSCARA